MNWSSPKLGTSWFGLTVDYWLFYCLWTWTACYHGGENEFPSLIRVVVYKLKLSRCSGMQQHLNVNLKGNLLQNGSGHKVHLLEWPSNSPNLNPIEILWNDLCFISLLVCWYLWYWWRSDYILWPMYAENQKIANTAITFSCVCK